MTRPVACAIGVAIALPEPLASTLSQLRREAGDPQAAIVPHVTLLPPSVVPVDELDPIERYLDVVAARHAPFELRLAGAGSFRPVSQVVFAHVSEGIASCELLAADVCSGPLGIERTFPYHPHVTVAQDVGAEALEHAYDALRDFDATVWVGDFTLFEQRDTGWHVRRLFDLGHLGLGHSDVTRPLRTSAAVGPRSRGTRTSSGTARS